MKKFSISLIIIGIICFLIGLYFLVGLPDELDYVYKNLLNKQVSFFNAKDIPVDNKKIYYLVLTLKEKLKQDIFLDIEYRQASSIIRKIKTVRKTKGLKKHNEYWYSILKLKIISNQKLSFKFRIKNNKKIFIKSILIVESKKSLKKYIIKIGFLFSLCLFLTGCYLFFRAK